VMQALWQLYGLVVLMGLAIAALGDVSVGQLVSRWVDRGRGLALGIVYSGSNIGGWLLVPLAVDIASRGTWRDAFGTFGAGALLLMLPVAIFVCREPSAYSADGERGDDDVVLGSDRDLDLAAAMRTRSFWILAFTLFTFFFYFLSVLEHLVLYLTDSGMERKDAALFFSYSLGLGIVSKIGLGAIADRMPNRASTLLVYGVLVVSTVALLALPHATPRETALWIWVATFAFATASRDVVYPLIIAECFGVRYLAQIYGAIMVALLPGGTLGPIFAASIHDRFGSYALAFQTFLLLNVAAFTALLFVRRESGRASAD